MTINKNTIVIGMRIRVTDIDANTAGVYRDPINSDLTRRGLSLYVPGNTVELATVARIGDVLKVTKLPRKVHRVNFCQVKTEEGITGEVFWTELKYNCSPL